MLERPSAVTASYPAQIFSGSCAAPGEVAFALGDVEPQTEAVRTTQPPVAVGVSTIDSPLSDLLGTGYAIGVGEIDAGTVPVACGDISRSAGEDTDELVVGLQDATNAENIGVAVLRDDAERTAVTLYLLNPALAGETRDATLAVPDAKLTVEILDGWAFQPYSLEVAPGDTVTWVNNSDAAHTVTGDDLAFDDSGLIEPGDSFNQTFDQPGMYHYKCGPHPGMVGVIVVR